MKIIIISAIVFFAIFFLIATVRLILFFLLNHAYKRYKVLKNKFPVAKRMKKKYIKEEDELRRKREVPRAHSAVKAEKINQTKNTNYEILSSEEEENDLKQMNQVEIVDLVKPIGFWTSMILGQKLTYLIQSANALNKNGNKGFWVSMIEAKDRTAGRQHGRG